MMVMGHAIPSAGDVVDAVCNCSDYDCAIVVVISLTSLESVNSRTGLAGMS